MRLPWGAPGYRPGDQDKSKEITATLSKIAGIDQAKAEAKSLRLAWIAAEARAEEAARKYREVASCNVDARAVEQAKLQAVAKADAASAAARACRTAEEKLAKLSS